jgi:hypothetical protein
MTWEGDVPIIFLANTTEKPTRANWFECYDTTLKGDIEETESAASSSTEQKIKDFAKTAELFMTKGGLQVL